MAENDDLPEVPTVPKIAVTLPPHPVHAPEAKKPETGGMRKTILASQAVGALVTPVIVLTLGGNYVDKHFGTTWAAITGVIVGFIAGVISLMQILKRMAD